MLGLYLALSLRTPMFFSLKKNTPVDFNAAFIFRRHLHSRAISISEWCACHHGNHHPPLSQLAVRAKACWVNLTSPGRKWAGGRLPFVLEPVTLFEIPFDPMADIQFNMRQKGETSIGTSCWRSDVPASVSEENIKQCADTN